ncbi:ABC transporter, permease protein [Listeria weihenstephanensis FSL R9-0317]|uniref:ABC transporter permease n=1 Tax=Listeria weihenstephanensis TaxID=1006155 RepID=A0A1S7FXS3_9LIST|nr:FtsX-like permease family protein [Listeria weihenstephanensis]AQY52244.1 ABC transporter permease [Listeria weihenstephanensis]EUJ35356.1 ABC transporter, permease protein [Listeria weihenstephanensis FSL R9-0317]
MKKALWKDIWREIAKSKGRFISIFLLIALGVAFFVGLKATGPDMINTTDKYYASQNLMDLQVQSTYGLNKDDIAILKNIPGAKNVQPGYTSDVMLKDSLLITKVFSLPENNVINKYTLTKGRLPQKSGEIAIDSVAKASKKYKIGDKITFVNSDGSAIKGKFQTTTFTVVGMVSSAEYIEKGTRGTSTIGNGRADIFAVIPEADFDSKYYSTAFMTFDNTASAEAYSDAYDSAIERNTALVKKALKGQPEARLSAIRADGQTKINDGKKEIADGLAEIDLNQQKLDDARAQIDQGWATYYDGKRELETKLADGQAEIDNNTAKLAQAKKDIAAAERKIKDGEAQISDAEIQLDEAQLELEDGQMMLDESKEQLAMVQRLYDSVKNYTLGDIPVADLDDETKQEIIDNADEFSPELSGYIQDYFDGTLSETQLNRLKKEATTQLAAANKEVAAAQKEINQNRQLLADKQLELEAKKRELAQAKDKLAQGKKDYANGMAQLESGKQKFADAKADGYAKLDAAKAKLDAAEATYAANLATFEAEKKKALAKIATAKKDIQIAQEKLDALELPKYFISDRTDNPGYTEYKDNADRIASLSTAFPVFFFLIAALVCLTTMTRMVEEQRTQTGTLKALGYSNMDIIAKFLVYGSLASITGTAIGLAIGFQVFPQIIFVAYGSLYNLPALDISFYWSYSLISLAVALFCTTLTAFVSCRTELRENAASLMRPKAPKNGKRILLERMPFIWKRMNFTSKVTARNIFRYKQRMLMTVLGVAGCTALLLTGFGLKNSIGDIVPLQYDQIMKYDAVVVLDSNATKTPLQDYNDAIANTPNIKGAIDVAQKNMTAVEKGVANQGATLITPKTLDNFEDYVVLRDRKTHDPVPLTNNGAVLSEKLAKLYGVKAGDSLTIKDGDNNRYTIKVTGITETYAMHYIYMTPTYYNQVFKNQPEYNTQLLQLKNTDQKWQDSFAEKMLKNPAVLAVTFTNTASNAFGSTMDSLDIVIIVLIISAAALAFIVLYNLTNINVSERIRELSTIKVLGFYPKEVTMYVYRENLILTVMGILVGFVLGTFLHRFVTSTAEVDILMFSPTIHAMSYLYAALLTLLFSTLVMIVMHVKLKRVDMIEALKSVE